MTIDALKAAEKIVMDLIDAENVHYSTPDQDEVSRLASAAAIARQDNLRPVLGAIRDAILVFTDKACSRSFIEKLNIRFVDGNTEDDVDRAIRHAECRIEGSKEEQLILLFGRTLGAIESAVDRGRGR